MKKLRENDERRCNKKKTEKERESIIVKVKNKKREMPITTAKRIFFSRFSSNDRGAYNET